MTRKPRALKAEQDKFNRPYQLLLNEALQEKLELARSKGFNIQTVIRNELEVKLNRFLETA